MVLGLAEVYWFMGFTARVSVTLMYSIFLVEDESQGENLVWQFVDHESIFETGASRAAPRLHFNFFESSIIEVV